MANVISSKRDFSNGRFTTQFSAVLDSKPTAKEVADLQIKLGYHPAGYGGPNAVRLTNLPDGTVKIVWTCSGSCD